MNPITTYRKRNKLTLEQLATRIGVTKSCLWKLENGVNAIDIDTAIAISRATDFEVRVADLQPKQVDFIREEIEREGAAA